MADLEKFRAETRAWLAANCPPEMRQPMVNDEDTFWGGRNTKFSSEPQRVWFERMRDKGWTVPDWPGEYGGGGLDPAEAKVMALRAEVMIRMEQHLKAQGWTQAEAARRLGITQPRVSRLLKGKWQDFSLDMLLTLAARAGLQPELTLAA